MTKQREKASLKGALLTSSALPVLAVLGVGLTASGASAQNYPAGGGVTNCSLANSAIVNCTAVGAGATATDAYGDVAVSTGASAFGWGANAFGQSATALGNGATANGQRAMPRVIMRPRMASLPPPREPVRARKGTAPLLSGNRLTPMATAPRRLA